MSALFILKTQKNFTIFLQRKTKYSATKIFADSVKNLSPFTFSEKYIKYFKNIKN